MERTGQPKTRAHLVARAGASSRRSEEANLATSLAGSRGRRMVHRRMPSRERRMVLLRMSCLASSARLDAMTSPPGCGTRTAARMWYLEPSCMLLVACMTVEWPLSACAVKRRRFPVGARPTRRLAPAGSNRSSHGQRFLGRLRHKTCSRAATASLDLRQRKSAIFRKPTSGVSQ